MKQNDYQIKIRKKKLRDKYFGSVYLIGLPVGFISNAEKIRNFEKREK